MTVWDDDDGTLDAQIDAMIIAEDLDNDKDQLFIYCWDVLFEYLFDCRPLVCRQNLPFEDDGCGVISKAYGGCAAAG
jgi:hypothetical protein